MVPDRQKVWTDGGNGRTYGRSQNYIPPTLSGDNKQKKTKRQKCNIFLIIYNLEGLPQVKASYKNDMQEIPQQF